MSFLPHWLLWGGIAASVPLVLHFFFRTKYRVVSWAAMSFLRESMQQTSRRLRFRELLLLLMRIALLVLLALVLALGIIRASSKWGGGGAVDAVMVIDVSTSMAAREGTATRLELAKKSALEIIDQLPSGSTVQVIASADRAELKGPASPTNVQQARHLINSLRVSDLTTNHLPGLLEAEKSLRRVHNPNREVYLFTDLQKRGWKAQASSLTEKAKEFNNETTKLMVVRCAKSTPNNAALVGIQPQSDLLHRGERVSISVLVRNTGKTTLHNVNVKLSVVGQREGYDVKSMPKLGPGETRGLLLSVELQRAGYLVLRASIDSDEMTQDNEFYHVVLVHDEIRVLVVDGAPNRLNPDKAGSFYLQQALQPVPDTSLEDYSIQVRVVSPDKAALALLEEADVCVLADVPLKPGLNNPGGHLDSAFLDQLDGFVRRGGGLLVLAGPHVDPGQYNDALSNKRKLLPVTFGQLREAKKDNPFHAAENRIAQESFLAGLRKEPLGSLLAQTEIRTLLEMKPSEGSRVELETADRQPLLVSGQVADGQVVCCATTADLKWNDWPLWGHYYVPMWRAILNQLLVGSSEELNHRVGQPILWQVPAEDAQRTFVLSNPEDDVLIRSHPRLESGITRLTLNPLQYAGLYDLKAEGKRSSNAVTALHRQGREKRPDYFAVHPDWRESDDLAPMKDGELAQLLGYQPTLVDATKKDFMELVGEQRRQEWTWLLAAVLALLLGETLFAWFCDRSV